MEKIVEWVDAFNKIARNENNFHSFYIYKTGEDIQATLTLGEVAPADQCRGGSTPLPQSPCRMARRRWK